MVRHPSRSLNLQQKSKHEKSMTNRNIKPSSILHNGRVHSLSLSLSLSPKTGRQRQTAILTHNFFYSWPYHAVLSWRPYLALLLFSRVYSNRSPLWATAPTERPHWLPAETPRLPQTHVGIYIYHFVKYFRSTAWLLPRIFTGASCLRISDWRLSQGSICNRLPW